MSWVAVASAAVGVYSASQQKSAAKKAAARQQAALEEGYGDAQGRLGPYSAFGRGALRNLGRLTGNTAFLGKYGSPEAEELAELKTELEGLQAPGYSKTTGPPGPHRWRKSKAKKSAYARELAAYESNKEKLSSRIGELETIVSQQQAQEAANPQTTGADYLRELPGYQFRFQEGERAVGANQSKRNMALSGAAMKELTQYGQGFASTEYDKEFNRLMSMAGLGSQSDTALANAALGFSTNIAGLEGQRGADQANYYQGLNNAFLIGSFTFPF